MRKLLLLWMAGLSSVSFAQSQLPNADFEDWTLKKPAFDFYDADSWQSGIACASAGGNEQCTTTILRSTDAQSGTYSVKYFNYGTPGNVSRQTFSNIVTGTLPLNGVPFTSRPASVSYYYKYSTDDNQPMAFNLYLYTGSLQSPVYVGAASFSFSTPVTEWTQVTRTISYASAATPEYVYITVDRVSTMLTPQDTVYLDNFVFNYTTGTEDQAAIEAFQVKVVNGELQTSAAIADAMLVDTKGSVIVSVAGNTSSIGVQTVKPGFYALKGFVNGISVVRWIAIN